MMLQKGSLDVCCLSSALPHLTTRHNLIFTLVRCANNSIGNGDNSWDCMIRFRMEMQLRHIEDGVYQGQTISLEDEIN